MGGQDRPQSAAPGRSPSPQPSARPQSAAAGARLPRDWLKTPRTRTRTALLAARKRSMVPEDLRNLPPRPPKQVALASSAGVRAAMAEASSEAAARTRTQVLQERKRVAREANEVAKTAFERVQEVRRRPSFAAPKSAAAAASADEPGSYEQQRQAARERAGLHAAPRPGDRARPRSPTLAYVADPPVPSRSALFSKRKEELRAAVRQAERQWRAPEPDREDSAEAMFRFMATAHGEATTRTRSQVRRERREEFIRDARKCEPTAHAGIHSRPLPSFEGDEPWWTRDPSYRAEPAARPKSAAALTLDPVKQRQVTLAELQARRARRKAETAKVTQIESPLKPRPGTVQAPAREAATRRWTDAVLEFRLQFANDDDDDAENAPPVYVDRDEDAPLYSSFAPGGVFPDDIFANNEPGEEVVAGLTAAEAARHAKLTRHRRQALQQQRAASMSARPSSPALSAASRPSTPAAPAASASPALSPAASGLSLRARRRRPATAPLKPRPLLQTGQVGRAPTGLVVGVRTGGFQALAVS